MQTRLILLISFILFFSGCLDNATIEDRLACLELTSYSFTSVPDCISQEKCFEQVQAKFSFNETILNSKVQESIFNTENHLARAWLFLNKAKANLKIINNQCYSAKKLSSIPQQVNELNSNIVTVAEEIDSFNKEAAKAITFEINNLESEDINIVREEFLFDDYVILNQNIVDFSEKNIHNTTYASRFLFEAEKFNILAETLELQNIVNETTLFSILSENDKTILAESKKQDFPITFIAPIFTGLSDFLNNFFALSGSVQSLKNLPSFELFSALNNLLGSENSAASSFFGMFAENSKHRLSLQEKNSAGKIKINENLNIASQKVLLISQNYGDYFFPELLFPEDFGITTGFSKADFENFSQNFNKKIEKVKSSLRSLDEAEFLGKISLGQKTRLIKQLLEESENLLEELNYFDELLLSSNQTCAQKISEISLEITKPEFDSSNPVIISAKSRLNSQIKFFNTTQTISSCSEAIQTYSDLLSYLDSSNPGEEVSIQINSCISKAEALMDFDDGSLKIQLDSLKRIEKPFENPELVLNSCFEIRQKLEEKALAGSNVLLANQIYDEVSEKAVILENLLIEFPGLKSAKRATDFITDFSSIEPSFESSELILSEANNAEKLADNLTALSSGADKILQQLASEIIETYLKIEFLDSIGEIEGKFARIFIENPSEEINAPFSAVIELDSSNAEEIFSTGNISFLSQGKKTTLKFSKLLTGLNSIILDLNSTAKKSKVNVPAENNFAKNDFLDFAEKQRILFEKELLLEKAKSALTETPDVKLSAEKIQFYADQNKLEKAAEELRNLGSLVNFASLPSITENAVSSEEIAKISALKLSIGEKLSLLESNFSGLSKEQLDEVYAFSPITIERIQEIKNQLEKTELIEPANLVILEAIDKELTLALEKLKQNSLSSYNVAVSKRNSSEPNTEADSLLLKSKQSLEEKSYLESIYNSNKATNLTGLATIFQPFEIPLAVYPLILVLIGVAFYVHKKSEEEKKPKPTVKIKRASND
ncbi:MAG: hypothetical protein NUV57_06055 [archaeon]|nr:hypothetical protein [archaeon]